MIGRPSAEGAAGANGSERLLWSGDDDAGSTKHQNRGAKKSPSRGGFLGWVNGVFEKAWNGGGGDDDDGDDDDDDDDDDDCYSTPRRRRGGSNAIVPVSPGGASVSPGGGGGGGGGYTPSASRKRGTHMKRKEKLEMAMMGGMMNRHRSGNYKYRPLFADTPAGKRSRTAVRLVVYFMAGSIVSIHTHNAVFARLN